jgi:uncharacterized membrane protein YozB (DUF420 family)
VDVTDLPRLNACLNGIATVLLLAGYDRIRRRQISAHRACMLSAFAVSVLFLISYVIYHYNVGSVKFPGIGIARTAYLVILFTHVVLAALVPFMAIATLYLAFRGNFVRHRRLARWTFPIWLYVSVTGVVIYVVLYHVYDATIVMSAGA